MYGMIDRASYMLDSFDLDLHVGIAQSSTATSTTTTTTTTTTTDTIDTAAIFASRRAGRQPGQAAMGLLPSPSSIAVILAKLHY